MLPLLALAAATTCLLPRVGAQDAAAAAAEPFFYKSHDLSSLRMLENGGGAVFYDTAQGNASRPLEDILRDGGMNSVKLRLFVDPTGADAGKYDLAGTLAQAQRFVTDAGFRLLLNLHLSDTWADPGRQTTPRAWPADDRDGALSAATRAYVRDTLAAFCAAGAAPSLVTLGNEISRGMLWPAGRFDPWAEPEAERTRGFAGFAALFAAARAGVDDAVAAAGGCAARPDVAVHLDAGWDTQLYANVFGALFHHSDVVRPADVDVFGLTLYPFYGREGTFANLRRTAEYLLQTYPGSKVHVLETDWPVDCDGTFLAEGREPPVLSEQSIPVSAEGQLQWIGNLTDVMRSLPGGRGQGVSYWEGAWLNLTSLGDGGCDDLLLFDQQYSDTSPQYQGYSRPSVNIFQH